MEIADIHEVADIADIAEVDEDCPICGIELNKEYTHKLPCNHEFHYECLLKSFKMTKGNIKKHHYCPYCRKAYTLLPIVNGLKKIEPGIHVHRKDYYMDIGLGTIYNAKLVNLKNEPCKAALKKGKRKGQLCGKHCKLGYEFCGTHNKI